MKKVIRYVDEDTLEIKEITVEEETEKSIKDYETEQTLLQQALGCDIKEFTKKYEAYKNAEAEFNAIYEPFKANLLELHETHTNLPKNVVIGHARITYVSPSTRHSIDTKKLKEEEPELAKKYTKATEVKPTIRLENKN